MMPSRAKIPADIQLDTVGNRTYLSATGITFMSEPIFAATADAELPPAPPGRKPWSTPRVIVSRLESTEGGMVNIPEADSGLLTS